MKQTSPQYAERVSQRLTYLCRLFTLTLFNGTVLRYTDLDRDIKVGGFDYKSGQVAISSVRNSLGTGLANATVTMPLKEDETDFTELGVRNGVLDGAKVKIELVSWRNPEHGTEHVLSGKVLGIEFTDGGTCDLELGGLTSLQGGTIGETYSQECRNDFGDEQCRYPVETLATAFVIVDAAADNLAITVDIYDKPDGYWNYGTVLFTSGQNNGFAVEVALSNADGLLILPLTPPFPMVPGDTGTVMPGCDFNLSTCRDRWGNTPNYRGEPHVPTGDERKLMVTNANAPAPEPPFGEEKPGSLYVSVGQLGAGAKTAGSW